MKTSPVASIRFTAKDGSYVLLETQSLTTIKWNTESFGDLQDLDFTFRLVADPNKIDRFALRSGKLHIRSRRH